MQAFAVSARSASAPLTEAHVPDTFAQDVQPILLALPEGASVPPVPTDRLLRLVLRLRKSLPQASSLQSFATQLGVLHLALFYLDGKFYTWSQRVLGVRYLTASSMGRRPQPGQRPPSYAVLGVLLLIQLGVKALRLIPVMRLIKYVLTWVGLSFGRKTPSPDEVSSRSEESSVIAVEGERYTLQHGTAQRIGPSHAGTEALFALDAETDREKGAERSDMAIVPLSFPDPEGMLWPGCEHPIRAPGALGVKGDDDDDDDEDEASHEAAAQRARDLAAVAEETLRCTLCMDRREPQVGTSAVLECGHVFDWECIVGWAGEKAECPLCRQSIAPQRIWPVYNL